jgi:tetratricopeptide (TPR) repeat protein
MVWRNYRCIIVAAGLLVAGCRGELPPDINAAPPLLPVIRVVQLNIKPPGDHGQPIVRQNRSDDGSAPKAPAKAEAAPLTQWTPAEQLSPVGSGAGLVVSEPVATQADATTADFGAGCGRWLHLTVSGQPALGRTPLWSSWERAKTELGQSDLRLTLPDAERLASILGVTHVATGQISGGAGRCTLTYQLWVVPSGKAAGAAIRVTGTQAQVVAQLPQVARRLAAQIGIPQARLPASVAAQPTDMGFLGRLPWYADTLPTTSLRRLQGLSARLPLASLFLVNTSGLLSGAQWDVAVKALLAHNPDNPLIWAQIGYSSPGLVHAAYAQLARDRQAFPQNYLFAATDTWVQRKFQQANAERRAAEQTVRDAPRNPDAWLTLGSTISEEGQRLRLGRFANDLSPREWAFLNTVYPQWLYAVSRSAQLDPLFGKAWERTAQAATFAGQARLADQAFWKNVALAKNNLDAYGWGLQMYQDKWYGDASKLHQVAHALATIPYATVTRGLDAAKMLKENEQEKNQFRDDRLALLNSLLARTQQAIAHSPGDAQAHYDQAVALDMAGRRSEAIMEYKNVVLLRPSDPDSYLNLGDVYDQAEMTGLAVAQFQQAVRLSPNSALAHYDLGWDLKHGQHFPEAEKEMRQALRLSPSYAEAHYGLGQVLLGERRNTEAAQEMRKAADLNPFFVDAYDRLCVLLDQQGRYGESLAVGRHAVQISPRDNTTMDTMADDYLHLHDWNHSIQMSQSALQIEAGDAIAHENLGEAYIGQGRTAEAHDEWNTVLTLDHGDVAKAARDMLAKHP